MRQATYYALVESWRELIVLRGVDCNRFAKSGRVEGPGCASGCAEDSVLVEHRLTAEPVPIFTLAASIYDDGHKRQPRTLTAVCRCHPLAVPLSAGSGAER